MPTLPPIDKNVNLAPHTVLLGAGASIAAYLDWGKSGNPLPSMQDLVNMLSLRTEIAEAGYDLKDLNFESFYDELTTSGPEELRELIESRVYTYFASLSLPDIPPIYDYWSSVSERRTSLPHLIGIHFSSRPTCVTNPPRRRGGRESLFYTET